LYWLLILVDKPPSCCSAGTKSFALKKLRSSFSVCILYSSEVLVQFLSQHLHVAPAEASVSYKLAQFGSETDFLSFIKQENYPVDCLILQESSSLQALLDQLQQQSLFLPAVIVRSPVVETASAAVAQFSYHTAVLELAIDQLNQIEAVINRAINEFIQLSPAGSIAQHLSASSIAEPSLAHRSLMVQQVRLAEKLKERLGYLGVYYKRNPQHFLRHMTQPQQEELLRQLTAEYREIVLTYFSDETGLNQRLDNFINTVFLADVPVSQIVEIHMELMDEFSKQLKLEGRSDEMLQDYRLTLIDTLAHLCEMYRRSIPRNT
jgi:circadian clock protein KaiA